MGPLHLYVVCIVCEGRESHRGVFLKRALGPPILRKYAYRSRFRFRKCASSSPWRGGGMSLSRENRARRWGWGSCGGRFKGDMVTHSFEATDEALPARPLPIREIFSRRGARAARWSSLPKLCVATCIVTPKSGRPFQPWLTMRGESLQKMRVVSVRSGSDSAFLCESGSVSGVRNAYFRKCGHRRRSVARSFGSPIEISREWEGHHGSSITRIFGRTTTRIFGSGSCRRGTQFVLPDRGGCLTIFARLLRAARADLGNGGRPKGA
jgi:hypothetical protein